MIYDILEELKETTKGNVKKSILTRELNNSLFRKVLVCALDPNLQSGMKKIPEYKHINTTLSLDSALDMLYDFYDSKLTGYAARDKLEEILSNLDKEDALVIEAVIRKDLDCGIGDSIVNSVFGANFITETPYMRCSLVNVKTILNIDFETYGYAVSEHKEDGQYLNHIINTEYISVSRNGKMYDFLGTHDDDMIKLKEIVQRLDPRFSSGSVFNGECLVLDENNNILPRELGNGIINKAGQNTITQEEAERTVFVLWDLLPHEDYTKGIWDVSRRERRELLEAAINELNSNSVRMVEYKKVLDIDEAFDYNEDVMSSGKEGTILKCESGIWKDGTSTKQLKMKLEMTVDLIIKDFNLGDPNSKFKNTLGTISAESSDGIIKVNVSGFKEKNGDWTRDIIWSKQDELREGIMSVVTTGITQNKKTLQYSLYLARFDEFRFDKSTADSYDRILEIKESAILVLREKLRSKKKK